MGLLAWIGLQHADACPNLDALLRELRRALPGDEGVVLRYVAVVVMLLGKIAVADGRVTAEEDAALRTLLTHVPGLAPSGVDAVCAALRGKIPHVTDDELSVCYRELRSLCDRRERIDVLRLLAELAVSDGASTPDERVALENIAAELGVGAGELAAVEREVATEHRAAARDAAGASPIHRPS